MASDTLIKRLHRELGETWEEAKRLNDKTADGGSFTAEEERIWQMLNSKMDETRGRIGELEEAAERQKALDEQRAEWEQVVRPAEPEKRRGEERPVDDRILEFVRGGLPGSDWAPRSIEFKLGADIKKPWHEQRDLVKGTPSAGGMTVPTGFIANLYEHLVEAAGVRQTNAIVYTTDSGEDLLVPKTLTHNAAALVAENAAIPESDGTFGQATLNAYKYGVIVQVSNELATDTGIDLLGYLARSSGRALGLASGAHFVTGTGTGQPQGAHTAATVGKQGTTGQTLTVIYDDLVDVYHSIVTGYRSRGVWLMNDSSLAKVRKLKDTQGNPLWQPGLIVGQPDLLLGRPLVTDPNVPVMAASAKSILFGDFSSFYAIRDVSGVRFERSDEFAFNVDLISFRALLRTDGKALDLTAVKAYQNSAT